MSRYSPPAILVVDVLPVTIVATSGSTSAASADDASEHIDVTFRTSLDVLWQSGVEE